MTVATTLQYTFRQCDIPVLWYSGLKVLRYRVADLELFYRDATFISIAIRYTC